MNNVTKIYRALDLFGPNCAFCNKPCPDYKQEFCCNGRDCGCQGMPIEPCFCSNECYDAAHEVGTIEERAKKHGIKLYEN